MRAKLVNILSATDSEKNTWRACVRIMYTNGYSNKPSTMAELPEYYDSSKELIGTKSTKNKIEPTKRTKWLRTTVNEFKIQKYGAPSTKKPHKVNKNKDYYAKPTFRLEIIDNIDQGHRKQYSYHR
jgi:hypothetical protein